MSKRESIIKKVGLALGADMTGRLGHTATDRIVSIDQMPHHFAKRFDVSLRLFLTTHYLPFISGGGSVAITVGGAKYQDRYCTAGNTIRTDKGIIQYAGLQAAHLRLGSYAINGTPAASCWLDSFTKLAVQKGLNTVEAGKDMIGYGHFTGQSLLFEGKTCPQDALINQSFGTIESSLHQHLALLSLSHIPTQENSFFLQMKSAINQYMDYIPMELLKIAEERALAIKRDSCKERMQADTLVDGYKPVFKSESDLLGYMISEFSESNSVTNQLLEQERVFNIRAIDSDIALLTLAKEEAGNE